jgi:hypothetical protein
MASTYLSRTGIGSSNNQKKWTFSGWFKKASNGSELRLITSSDNSSYDDNIRFNAGDTMKVVFNNATVLNTNRLFRDNNAYYHIVVKVDTDQSTANDRIVLYINGVDERTVGGYSTSSMPNQGTTGYINYNQHYIGVTNPSANSNHFNGIMSHVHFTDGYAYTPTSFGETDSTTGEWKIKVDPSVSYGTTGFWILKDGNSVTDSSPNSNTFTVSAGTLTKTEDCPSNVFATFNPLFLSLPTGGLSNGNTTATTAGADSTWRSAFGNLGATSGKYYMEVKWVSGSHFVSGFASQKTLSTHNFKDLTDVYSGGQYFGIYGTQLYTNGSASGSYTTQASGNIIQLALDMDNKKIYQGINGTWNVGGNPSSGNGISISGDTDEFWTFGISTYSNSGTGEYHANFGNGYFATTAVSSAGTNASGNGIFEYDCPNGYTALSTKGLNT